MNTALPSSNYGSSIFSPRVLSLSPSRGIPVPPCPGGGAPRRVPERGRGGDTPELPAGNPRPRFRNFLQNSRVESVFASFFRPVISPFAPMQRSHLLCRAFPTVPGFCRCKSWLCPEHADPFRWFIYLELQSRCIDSLHSVSLHKKNGHNRSF